MRNIIATVLILVTTISLAQDKGNVEFGLGVGFNYATVSTDNFSADTGFGLNLALGADYYFSDRWSIKTQVIYDQKGWDNGTYTDLFSGSFDPIADGSMYETNYNLNYLTVPVMANWHFGSKRNWYLNFGPYVGFLLSAKETAGGVDVTEIFNATDFGLALGLGVKIPVSDKLKLSLEYGTQTGFLDIFKDNDDSSIRNSRGVFSAGLNFMMN